MKVSREFWVGLFSLFGLLILGLFTVQLRNWDWLSGRETYFVLFERVSKLDIGAPVLVRGVQEGQVSQLEYVQQGPYRVKVTLRLQREVDLYPDAVVQVSPAAVIGTTTIDIDAGNPSADGGRPLRPGSVINGVSKPQIEEMASQVSQELVGTLRDIRQYLNDQQIQSNFRTTLSNLTTGTLKLNQTLDLVNRELGPMATNLGGTWTRVNDFISTTTHAANRASSQLTETGRAITATAQTWEETGRTLTTELRTVSQRLQSLSDRMDQTLQVNQEPLAKTLTELQQTTRDLRLVLEKIQSGQGTLGRLVTDPSLFDQLKDMVSALSQALTGRRQPVLPANATPSAGEP